MRLDTCSPLLGASKNSPPRVVSIGKRQSINPELQRLDPYRVRVAGKLFQGHDLRTLLRLAVAAKRGLNPA